MGYGWEGFPACLFYKIWASKHQRGTFLLEPKSAKGYSSTHNRTTMHLLLAIVSSWTRGSYPKKPSGRKSIIEEVREEQPHDEQQMEVETSPPLFETSGL